MSVIHNQVFHVGSNEENYQIIELAKIVQKVVPNSILEFSTDHDGDQRTYNADFSKIKRLLPQFVPAWNAESGAYELYEAYNNARLTVEQFTGSKYIRLNRIDELLNNGLLDSDLRWQ